ncbi:hypothetical protein [Rheinheimera sp.]|uniref:hypothetical protein n=1 Tax=Rheinheimera sp. TaxID=1869214 RepID=UPI0023535765|nr:hypothetical protein [Rheinheimera sp.]
MNEVTIRTGWTFSKAIENQPDGEYSVIQLRDVQTDRLEGIHYSNLTRTDISATREIKTLQDGDILLVAKGPTKYATYLEDVPANIVANQHFLILTVQDKTKLLPAYLEVYLNSKPVQDWFARNGGGSYQSTLTKKTLLGLKLPTHLTLHQQQKLADLHTSIAKEKHLYHLLMKQRQQELDKFSNLVWKQLNEK